MKARPACATAPHVPTAAHDAQQLISSSEFSSFRSEERRGQDWIGPEVGVSPRTVSAILRRHGVPYLRECDPLTGEVIRASRTTTLRYERPAPGDLIHVDVKKIGKIPDGGGWRARGRAATVAQRHKRDRIGYDYVHAAVDDHSRLAYAEILDDETGPTCAKFILRAALFFLSHGITVREVVTDNARNYTVSYDFQAALGAIGARHLTIRPHWPVAERKGREVQPNDPGRVGLPPGLHQQHRASRRP